MNSSFSKLAATALLGMTLLNSAYATTITFDDLASGTALSNQYSALGVTFSAVDHGGAVNTLVQAYANASSPNVWSNCFPSFCSSRADVVRMDFAAPVSGFSLWVDTNGNLTPTFNAYDAGGTLLESVTVAMGQGTFAFSSSNISYVEGLQPIDNWGYTMDNLTFNAARVPEPASLALLGLGMLGLAAGRRRKQ